MKHLRLATLIAVTCGLVASGALGQSLAGRSRDKKAELQPPDLAGSVTQALEAAYLSEEERAAKRVFHGVWRESDLENPALRARAALIVGVFDDPSLTDPGADPLDRAEGALLRGDLDEALRILEDRSSPRADRIRAEALEGLGRFKEANDAITPLVERLLNGPAADAPTLTEAARALGVRARIEGKAAGDYQNLMDILGRAQQEIDRLYWPAVLEQAQLLYEKDNWEESQKAIVETLGLNPSCARAWELFGRMRVDTFDFDTAERIADRLTRLRARFKTADANPAPQGDLLMARARMRQSDPEGALTLIERVLDRLPRHREALALSCAAHALTYDFERVDQLLSEFDALSPGSPEALFEVGKALSEARQYGRAADYLRRAVQRQPKWAPPVVELGLLEMQSGRDTEALSALRDATALDPFHVRARNSLVLVKELASYNSLESDHFIVRYSPGIDGVMARDMIEPLEEIHRWVCAGIEHEPKNKTVIELLPDHEWFAVRITGMTGIHTIAASTGPVIAMEAPREGKTHFGIYDWVRVVRHEYTHTVTLSRTNNRIPHWFTEAAAVYTEHTPRDYNTCQLLVMALLQDELFDMKKINIAFVRPEKETDRPQAYAQGHWMYTYIVEKWGKEAPLKLMDLYAQGKREAAAMQEVLGITQEEFLAQFKQWARADAATWGMLPERSIQRLLVDDFLATTEGATAAKSELARFAQDCAHYVAGGAPPRKWRLAVPEPTSATVDRLLATHPEHPDLLELKISEAIELAGGAPNEAMIPLLEKYAAARPVDPMPHRHLARLYLETSAPERAIPHLEYLDAREQKTAAYAVELARRYAALNEWDKAWTSIIRATRIAPYDPALRELAASVAMKRSDLSAAEHQIQALVELEPKQDIHRQRLERLRELKSQQAAPAPAGG